ncbi:MAG: DNA translocase FtsK [candidate division Zixibacteria bacterium]|nr:DNA translocase FtsK [candidate division Zixibacteria bacterium]
MKEKRKIQIIGILLATFALLSFISLIGHSPSDDLMITSNESVYGNPFSLPYVNLGGMMGAYFSYVAFFFLGLAAYFAVFYLFVLSFKIVGFKIAKKLHKHAAMLWVLSFLVLILVDIKRVATTYMGLEVPDGVGALGHTLIEVMIKIVGVPGAYIVAVSAMVCTLIYYWSISHRYRDMMTFFKEYVLKWFDEGVERAKPQWDAFLEKIKLRRTSVVKTVKKPRVKKGRAKREIEYVEEVVDEPVEDNVIIKPPAPQKPNKKNQKVTLSRGAESKETKTPDEICENSMPLAEFDMPGVDLLTENANSGPAYDTKELEDTAKNLRDTLETFGVNLSGNIEMFPGPIITRFEIKPAAGIKVNQIANLSDDLALNLRAKSIRIVAPVPGKAAVGIEIPNRNPQVVYLRDIIESDDFQNHHYELPLAMGTDISGKPFTVDLTSMPHLLIAGTTGSGKSVCINVVITSLMYALHPKQLKFIFIDPKMLELTVYQGIPYLNERVVTNPKQAERVLGDAVAEMERRYRTLANESVRNIVDYNKKMDEDKKLPYLVIIIDELADLMMSGHSSRIELLITRLAQMARAVGIHLILATQRPSVDVITGLIKANFPSRLAFQVATRTDSRTILDGNGAERLLGKGDMLYLETGSPEPERLHGAYVSSDDTNRIVAFMKQQSYSKVKVEEAQVQAKEKSEVRQFTTDPVMLEAVATVVRQGQASVSLLQRKLGIGYQRAARLIDELEDKHVIGPYNESKAREVLVDKTFLESIKNGKMNKA